MATQPARTAVLVLNYNGARFLPDCLESLGRLDVFVSGQPGVPAGELPGDEVWVVDNGSQDGSPELVRRRFPWVKVFALPENLGFSEAYNRAVEACHAAWVAFLNNDTRVTPDWLSQLHACAARHPQTTAVASRILSWDGNRVDFEGADTFFFGQATQRRYGEPAGPNPDEVPLLFGCAGALMVRRERFLELGGFDSDYFSFFEDVDLGWRLNLAGDQVWFCPQAVVYHRGHGTWGEEVPPKKRILLERNGLANVYKNWGDERVGVFFLGSVILTLLRGLVAYGDLVPQMPPRLSAETLAHLSAVADFARLEAAFARRRQEFFRHRKLTDEELLPLFGSFTEAPLGDNPTMQRLYRWLLWRLALGETGKLPAWDMNTNNSARVVSQQLLKFCQLFMTQAPAARVWSESDPRELYPLPLSLARAIFHLFAALQQFLTRELSPESLSWLSKEVTRLNASLAQSPVSSTWEPPPVSVIIRTRNRPRFLAQALASVASQKQKPSEVVVVNDGGEDPTPVTVGFSQVLPIKMLHLHPPQGRTRAAQEGLLASSGVLACFLDDDDQWLPNHLEVLLAAFAHGARVAYSDVDVVHTDDSGERVVARGTLGGAFDPVKLLFENYIPILAVLFERDLALEVGGMDGGLEYFEDWDLWIRLSQKTSFVHCPEVTARYFVRPTLGHGQATSGEHRWPPMAKVFHKHRQLISGWMWAEYFRNEVEATRLCRNRLARDLEQVVEELKRIHRSRSWRLLQKVRRFLVRG
ncbi:MAG: glycosyltransferase [Thermoanaerobaculum sp.]